MSKITNEDVLNLVGDFTYNFGHKFFIETSEGNFVWSDPSYGGDNTLCRVSCDYKTWCKDIGIPFGRDKGKHFLRDYCVDYDGNVAKVVQ